MEPMLKQRLVGAAVLVALAVLFVPMLLDDSAIEPRMQDDSFSRAFDAEVSEVIPLDQSFMDAADERFDREFDIMPTLAEPGPDAAATAVAGGESAGVADAASAPAAAATAAAADAAPSASAWIVQMGVFENRDNAAELEARLRGGGFSAFVEASRAGGSVVYRVLVGPELTRADADRVRTELAAAVRIDGIVRKHP